MSQNLEKRPRKLLDQGREAIRLKHYSIRVEETYISLERKYRNADREWIWQYMFPDSKPSQDPRTGVVRRHHLHESSLQKAVKKEAPC